MLARADWPQVAGLSPECSSLVLGRAAQTAHVMPTRPPVHKTLLVCAGQMLHLHAGGRQRQTVVMEVPVAVMVVG